MKNRPRTWVFDFDGTLSELTENRRKAVMNRQCRLMLRRLCAAEDQIVAVVSSRTLDDLTPRVKVPGVVLAGGSGMEFRLPGGCHIAPDAKACKRADHTRRRLLPALHVAVGALPGVDIEDKRWSVAVHMREADIRCKRATLKSLTALVPELGLTFFRGPEVIEISCLSGQSKVRAVKTLRRLYTGQIALRRLILAGDDQNDLETMKWVQARGGTCIVVGDSIRLAGAERVGSPAELAEKVQQMLELRQDVGGFKIREY